MQKFIPNLKKMSIEAMFPKFLRFIFLLNGLPVYCTREKRCSFILHYIWRILFIIKCNMDFVFHIFFMSVRWIFPHSLFALIGVTLTVLIVDSLIGKHRRIINLQKIFIEDLNKKRYFISSAKKLKIKILQAMFGMMFCIKLSYLIYSLSQFADLKHGDELSVHFIKYKWLYIFITASINLSSIIANSLYYCIFCKYLQAMFQSINIKAKELDKLHAKEGNPVENAGRSRAIFRRKRIRSFDNALTGSSSIFPTSLSFWPKNSLKTSSLFSLPHLYRSKKAYNSAKGKTISKKINVSGFSTRSVDSLRIPRYLSTPSYHAKEYRSKTEKLKQNSFFARKLQNLNKKFASVSLLVQETDNLFSLQVLTILTITFLRTCGYIYIYISSDWPINTNNATITIIQQIFFDFLTFGSVALEASLVMEEARKFSPILKRTEKIGNSKSIRVQLQSDIAQATVYTFDVQLTAWKFFTVSRSFIPTVIGVTTTYVLIIFQMHQIFLERECSLFRNVNEVHGLNDTEKIL